MENSTLIINFFFDPFPKLVGKFTETILTPPLSEKFPNLASFFLKPSLRIKSRTYLCSKCSSFIYFSFWKLLQNSFKVQHKLVKLKLLFFTLLIFTTQNATSTYLFNIASGPNFDLAFFRFDNH